MVGRMFLSICIIVVTIAVCITSKPKLKTVDTSMFVVISLEEALELFEKEEPSLLIMSVETCTATIDYVK